MTQEKYNQIHTRLAALERLILAPARHGKGGKQHSLLKKKAPHKPQHRRRLDSL
jgi:hypothetical protein